MNVELIKAHVRTIPDFPKPGILFRDITTVYKNADCLQELTRSLTAYYKDKGITKVLGIESRGYTMASILAQQLNAGFVFVRKPGKLPARTVQQSYEKEYIKCLGLGKYPSLCGSLSLNLLSLALV